MVKNVLRALTTRRGGSIALQPLSIKSATDSNGGKAVTATRYFYLTFCLLTNETYSRTDVGKDFDFYTQDLGISYCFGKNVSPASSLIRDAGKKCKNRECPAKIGTVGNPDSYWYSLKRTKQTISKLVFLNTFFQAVYLIVGERRAISLQFPFQPESRLVVVVGRTRGAAH